MKNKLLKGVLSVGLVFLTACSNGTTQNATETASVLYEGLDAKETYEAVVDKMNDEIYYYVVEWGDEDFSNKIERLIKNDILTDLTHYKGVFEGSEESYEEYYLRTTDGTLTHYQITRDEEGNKIDAWTETKSEEPIKTQVMNLPYYGKEGDDFYAKLVDAQREDKDGKIILTLKIERYEKGEKVYDLETVAIVNNQGYFESTQHYQKDEEYEFTSSEKYSDFNKKKSLDKDFKKVQEIYENEWRQ